LSPNADALVTNEPGILLLIRTADCFPVLFFDNTAKVIGNAHAGRKGVEGNILRETILKMQQLGAKVEHIQIIFGAGICGEHYPVDNKTFNTFLQNTRCNQIFPYLDLKSVLYQQAFQIGISNENIREISRCTFRDENFFSYRENNTTERQISLLGMDTWK
jgi:YfiH family protein